ncbi:MAG: glycosyltransferase [Fidelibacterota bacterium]
MTRENALISLGFRQDRPVVAIIGGSQGSRAINSIIQQTLPLLQSECHVQVYWQTGPDQYEKLATYNRNDVKVEPFSNNMGAVYTAADLIISRAGAMTLSEITACGKPSILIPFPGAAADHQTKNAATLVANGAARIIPEFELTPEKLADEIIKLLKGEKVLKEMAKAAQRTAINNAAERIVTEIERLAQA